MKQELRNTSSSGDHQGKEEELESYKPGPPAIKVSLGLVDAVNVSGDDVKVTHDGVEDLKALTMW